MQRRKGGEQKRGRGARVICRRDLGNSIRCQLELDAVHGLEQTNTVGVGVVGRDGGGIGRAGAAVTVAEAMQYIKFSPPPMHVYVTMSTTRA